ncbi:hypothetical protein [Methylohalobius crimeensis]|uniref:hypothetical protein n=1 Tax=Methylohalobius crimeensis TaxID=244365 RepID=UPI0003B59282|nr:hypothetical protein [Methylohalobius crimeensis]
MNYSIHALKARKRQQGLTLLELTVVLLVLIGLSGLILPYAQGYLQRTHDSTGNDNLWELNNAINLFQSKYLEYPEEFHSLVDSSGAKYTKLMNTKLVDVVATPGMARNMSLAMAGINNLWTMKTSPTSATFDAVSALAPVTTTSTTPLAVVTAADLDSSGTIDADETLAHHLALAFYNNTKMHGRFDTTCYDYVVFGVGPESEMINTVMSDAPLHFASSGNMGPENAYNRFVTVFQVDKDNATSGCSTSTERAKLVGSAMLMMPNHLFGLANTQGHTWGNIASKNN